MPEENIGLLFNIARDGSVAHCDGSIMRVDGSSTGIVGAAHDLQFSEENEVREGVLTLALADGSQREVRIRNTGRGIYMDGAGYADWQGSYHGSEALLTRRWPLDGSVNPKNLGFSITDAFCEFICDGEEGSGILEYGLTRSPSFSYQPSSVVVP
jgi:hypothetical protein